MGELLTSKIEMRKDIDQIEDTKEFYEKELETTKSQLAEAIDEKTRLSGETESLKSLLKREVDKLDGEVASKNQVISEYKTICSQLSAKLKKAQANAKENDKDGYSKENEKAQNKKQAEVNKPALDKDVDKFNDRIKELEMELAQTKLALVETKCRNQELTHQIVLNEEKVQQESSQTSSSNKKWFAKTLYSIKESAVASSGFNSKPTSSITKSTSVDVLKSLPEND